MKGIKVIKKKDVLIDQTPPIMEKSSDEKKNRKLSSTVTAWVKELQRRHYEESMLALDQIPTP